MRFLPLLTLLTLSLPAMAGEALRVMSFNVRLPAKVDGPNHWEHRKDLLVDTIRQKAPDVFGTQELFHEQGRYIAEKLPGYAWFGVSRRGNQEDEHMGVFYRKDRLKLIDSGNFWLSETPETPGSMSWDVTLPRIVTWGLFETAGGRRFYFYNTHFAHRREDDGARLNSARLIAERVAQLPANVPFVLTGDFNSPAGGDVYKILTASLTDARTASPRPAGPEGTFNGFKGETSGPRIDWILYRGALKAVEAQTVTRNEKGRYPSDHFPVFAVLELK
ncbi:MAG TPA: endonuclease/exonuclease/phosphatase family protein [Bryobacteraceae bacterium]|nr:endonuclease/exonuclease/phosphatase family protein [Bryobacteraceae bacterium]